MVIMNKSSPTKTSLCLDQFRLRVNGLEFCAQQWIDQIVFALTLGDEIYSMIVCNIIEQFPGDGHTLQVRRSWTPEQYRRKGYSLSLYQTAARCGYRLISNMEQTAETITLWSKLDQLHGVQYFDIETEQFTGINALFKDTVVYVLDPLPFLHTMLTFDAPYDDNP